MQDPDKTKKEDFEQRLSLILAAIFQKHVMGVRQSIFDGKRLPNRDFIADDFRYSLDKHYGVVQDYFRYRVFPILDPVESTADARDIFLGKLKTWRGNSADEISQIISETNVIQSERAFEAAEAALTDHGSFSRFELSVTTAAMLKRLFDARRPVIALTETQAAAESTKTLKAESVEESSLKETFMVIKTWNSLLDGRERPTHGAASGQQRPEGSPFVVGGSSLMYPGDVRAPAAERINCRCFLTSSIIKIG